MPTACPVLGRETRQGYWVLYVSAKRWSAGRLANAVLTAAGSRGGTSNRSVGGWGSVFGDPVVATAILDRLLPHSRVNTLRGDACERRRRHSVSELLHRPDCGA